MHVTALTLLRLPPADNKLIKWADPEHGIELVLSFETEDGCRTLW